MKSFPFEVDPASDVPPWVQLRQRLAHLIETGYYRPGDQLPTVRGLASEISMNYNTVNKAYLSLASDGYIESTRGRGAFVRDLDRDLGTEHAAQVDALLDECIATCHELGLSYDDIQACVARKIKRCKRDAGLIDDDPAADRVVDFTARLQEHRAAGGASPTPRKA